MDLDDLTAEQYEHYQKLLPASVARTLAFMGLLQLTHDALKVQVLDVVKMRYGFRDKQWLVEGGEAAYHREVLALCPKKVFEASVLWLQRQDALTTSQAEALGDLKAQRDAVVHELADFVMSPTREPDSNVINRALEAFGALDRYWGKWALDNGMVERMSEGEVVDAGEVESNARLVINVALQAFNVQFPPQERER